MSVGNWVSFSFLKNFNSIFQDESTPRLQYPALTSDLLSSDAPLIETTSPKKMRQNENRSRMIRSNGLTVARTHMYDWFILAVLMVILAIIHVIHPFYRFVGKDMMTDLKYPLKSNTVPFWAVPVYSVALPMAIFIIVYLRRRDVYDLHHAVLGLLYSALVTAVITNSIKAAVGRPRPDFFWRCFPDGKDVYDRFGNVICHGKMNVIDEGHRSFPSGHTSWSFSGLGFLSLYLAGKIKAFDRKGHIAKLCLIFFPIVAASLVGISRVDDYKHYWQDVFAGGLLGLVVATFCYLQFFPPPYHAQGWVPYACFQHSESRPEVPLTGDAPINEVVMEGRPNETSGGNGCIGLSMPHASDTAPEDIESGVR